MPGPGAVRQRLLHGTVQIVPSLDVEVVVTTSKVQVRHAPRLTRQWLVEQVLPVLMRQP